MNPSQRTFATGILLGFALGLISGHLTLWRTSSFSGFPPPSVSTSERAVRLGGTGNSVSPYFDTIPGVNGWEHIGFDALPESGLPFTADSPLSNAIAIDDQPVRNLSSRVPASGKTITGLALAEPFPLPVSEAEPLKPSIQDTPPAAASATDDKTLREIIDRELAELNPDERNIWFEALREVNRHDVLDILRMWKQLGGPIPNTTLALPSTPSPKDAKGTPAVPSGNLITEAIEVRKRNLRQFTTPGGILMVPVFVEEPSSGVPASVSLRRVPHFSTERVTTMFPLDVAIVGPGFFVVTDPQGERYYTRCGRFSLDPQRRLSLEFGSTTYLLQPEIALPESLTGVEIDALGIVWTRCDHCPERDRQGQIELAQLLTPVHLQERGNGLFVVDDAHAAEVLTVRPHDGPGSPTLMQGALEYPVVQLEEELRAIQQLEALRKHP